MQYSVLEAQPDVLAHLHANRRAKVSRRSLRLTPFGEDFLNVGLGLGEQPTDDLASPVAAEPARPAAAEPATEPLSPIIDIHIRQSASVPPAWPTAVAAADPALAAVLDEVPLGDEPVPDEALAADVLLDDVLAAAAPHRQEVP